jgi:hypothetical protein
MVLISGCENGTVPVYPHWLTVLLDSQSGLIVVLAIASLWFGFRKTNEGILPA